MAINKNKKSLINYFKDFQGQEVNPYMLKFLTSQFMKSDNPNLFKAGRITQLFNLAVSLMFQMRATSDRKMVQKMGKHALVLLSYMRRK
jgi:hypothetical protein